ncbi:hypothetical protein [Chthonobacter albigriseus]|uniref:hypothetical protein n=1 Tax=Chthonobacter albigriseus TaxID=1683161 RepID=UPI0015EE844C|nr:hypothetical protein [Chthonobacter albigriseus]
MRARTYLIPLAAILATTVAAAEETHPMKRGTDGLTAVPFRADNRSSAAITCAATIAHWYSAEVGSAAPGASVTATLWSDPKTGEVFALNEHLDRMPLLRVWCGYSGADVSTASDLPLLRRAGAAEKPISVACHGAAGTNRLDCTPLPAP